MNTIIPATYQDQCVHLLTFKTVHYLLLSRVNSGHAQNCPIIGKLPFIKFALNRNPVAQSTDGSRGKIGFRQGRHAWEVMWEGPLGTVAVVGISTREAALQCHGYVALLGADDQSWGWNLVDNHLLHNGEAIGSYPLLNNAPKYQVGERIRVILDCDDNTLSFEKNYEFLGVAFRGELCLYSITTFQQTKSMVAVNILHLCVSVCPIDLPDKTFYPTVSAVYGNTEVSMVYLGAPLDG